MQLGIEGRSALVCASSRGLGKACAMSLAREGCAVVINGLDPERLAGAADEIRSRTGATVTAVPADINTEEGRQALLTACPEPDILVNNNAGPPPGEFTSWDRDQWMRAIEANMLAPIFLIKAVLPGMRARKFGRIINITSAMVKTPHATMGLSTSARTALTALCKSISFEVAAHNVTINNMLPERFDTDRQKFMAEKIMAAEKVSYEDARQRIIETIAAKRFGRPEEFGDACAFLCSAQARFISGQNLQLDGGSYRGLI